MESQTIAVIEVILKQLEQEMREVTNLEMILVLESCKRYYKVVEKY